MRCLVLGGAGFIGSHIVEALALRGHRVRVFDLPDISTQKLAGLIKSVEMIGGDFNNVKDIAHALEGIEVVIHLISTTLPGTSNENPVYDIESNLIATIKLLEQSVKCGVRKIVFASSGGTVYGVPQTLPIRETHQTNPICSYGITKLAIEKYLALFWHMHNLNYCVLRLGNPYGERQRINASQGAVAVFLGKVLNNEVINIWGDGSVARDYFYIEDLVNAFVNVVETDPKSKIYNIASGKAHSLIEILNIIQKVADKQVKIEYSSSRILDVPKNCLDIVRAQKEIGWNPTVSLAVGIERTWRWMQNSVVQ